MSPETRQGIQDCEGVYRPCDVARHYGVSSTTVLRVWATSDGPDYTRTPNITDTKITDDLILADTQVLLNRGMTLRQVAAHLGCTEPRIRAAFTKAGRRYYLKPADMEDAS